MVIILWHIHIVNHLCCTLIYCYMPTVPQLRKRKRESVKIRIFTSGNVKLDNFDLFSY